MLLVRAVGLFKRNKEETVPNDATGWYHKGYELALSGKLREAIKCCDKAVELEPNYVDGWGFKGAVLAQSGKHEDAIKCYDTAIEINPKDAGVWNGKGNVLNDLGKYEEAITCFEKAIELEPDIDVARNHKAAALEKLGRHEEVARFLGKSNELNSTKTLGVNCAFCDNPAKEECKNCVRVYPKDPGKRGRTCDDHREKIWVVGIASYGPFFKKSSGMCKRCGQVCNFCTKKTGLINKVMFCKNCNTRIGYCQW